MAKKKSLFKKPKKIKERKFDIPPCPDPDLFILVKNKDGSCYWRRKRGTFTEAKLNPVLAAMAKYKKPTMAAAARLVSVLDAFTCNRYADLKFATYKRNDQRFSGLFTRSIMANGKMDWSYFEGFDINPNCSLEKIMTADLELSLDRNQVIVKMLLRDDMVKKLRNYSATHFYFELILISGNPARENSLRSESDRSEYYPYKKHDHFNTGPKKYCELSLLLPEKKPYILILKAASTEKEWALGPNHEGLKVVGWG